MSVSSNDAQGNRNLQRRGYPEGHLQVLKAFERRWDETGRVPFEKAAVAGKNPFRRGKVFSYLQGFDVEAKYLGEIEAPDLLVVGRSWVENQEKQKIKSLLRRRQGKRLRLCSQEMLLAWAMTGIDPNKRPQTAETFFDGHAGLEFIKGQLGDLWPGTDPLPSSGTGEGGEFGPDESPLKRLGYEVGNTGKQTAKRREILREAYERNLEAFPGKYPEQDLDEWGPAKSGARLKRMADHIAGLCHSFRGRDRDFSTAIDDYESDLAWLKREYYSPLTYGFRWPDTT